MRRGAIEMEKIVVWAIGVILALIIILFIASQLSTNEGGLVADIISRLTGIGPE